MGQPTKANRMRPAHDRVKGACHEPGTNCKIFEANKRMAKAISGLTGELLYEVVNRILAKHLPAEVRRVINMNADLGGEAGA